METKTAEKIFYVPGEIRIIDTVTPDGLGTYSGETLEEVQKRYPGAILWDMDGFLSHLRGLEKSGKKNIVIGGSGEAEVNTKWTPEEAFAELCRVSEQCGYFTSKGTWLPHMKEIFVVTDGQYKLTYYHDKLDTIDRISTRRVW
jgi:hypothetical protein